jgi:hypothetical protein
MFAQCAGGLPGSSPNVCSPNVLGGLPGSSPNVCSPNLPVRILTLNPMYSYIYHPINGRLRYMCII